MTTHSIDLLTRDGERLSFPCGEDQTVAAAAAAVDLHLPLVCKEGGCGACHATCTDGAYELGTHNPAALPAGPGSILLCRTFPRGALTITTPFDRARIRSDAVPERRAEIAELSAIGGRTMRLLLRLLDDGEGTAAEFEPGQYMELEIPGTGIRRAYSLANTANWSGELEFLIRLQPNGRFSAFLEQDARPGAVLTVRGPQGGFTLRENGMRPRWFVAGGTGLAPMLSMLRRMAEWQDPQPARLYFGVNAQSDLFAPDALSQLAAELPQLETVTCVWRPGPGWTGFSGTPVDALAHDLAATGARPDLYLCGPPALIDAAEATAHTHGLPPDQVMSERFLPTST